MKLQTMMMLTVMGLAAEAQAEVNTGSITVPVYVRVGFSNSEMKLPYAEPIASALFAKAGVRIDWRTGEINGHDERRRMAVEIQIRTGDTSHSGALGVAMVSEGTHIDIFWDRMRDGHDRRLVNKLWGMYWLMRSGTCCRR